MSDEKNPSGYSGTPLVKKLGIKAGFKMAALKSPREYARLVQGIPNETKVLSRLERDLDMIHLFTKSRSELASKVPRMMRAIKPDGCIWISWPKKVRK